MSYWYLGSPYTKYCYGLASAHHHVCVEAARLIRAGVPVYSPIAHCHAIATIGLLDPLDHLIWLPNQKPMMDAAHGLIVLMLAGWEESYGLRYEIEQFDSRPTIYMTPGIVPEGLEP